MTRQPDPVLTYCPRCGLHRDTHDDGCCPARDIIPRSHGRRTIPAYKPARTPHVGALIHYYSERVVIIREAAMMPAHYWYAPVLADGTLGAMRVGQPDRHELAAATVYRPA